MGIKYAGRYSPRYYNPNWGPYSRKRLTWEAHNKKKRIVGSKPSNTSSSSPKPSNTTK